MLRAQGSDPSMLIRTAAACCRCFAGPTDDEAIELAFSKKKIEERKAWLAGFEPGTYLDQSVERDLLLRLCQQGMTTMFHSSYDFSHISSFFSPFSQGVAPVMLCPHAWGIAGCSQRY